LRSSIRPRLFVAAALLLVLGGAAYSLSTANADDRTTTAQTDTNQANKKDPAGSTDAEKQAERLAPPPSGTGSHSLIFGSKGSAQPTTMEQFLTAVTKDVDSYWTKTFKASGLPEPKVSYRWIPAGQTAASACGDEDGAMGDSAAAYCSADDTIYISEKFAGDIYNGTLDQSLPGSSQGYGRTVGDFAVAYIVAHEYGHDVQDELGLFDKYQGQVPTMGFELQADCYAGTWAKSAADRQRLEDGDVQEALDAALAVGDFDTSNPGHHGTPEQREDAWNTGFESGDPSSCSTYLDPASLGDGSGTTQQDPGTSAPQQDPDTGIPQQDPGAGSPQPDPGTGMPQQEDPGAGFPEEQVPAYPGDGTGYGYPQQTAAHEPRDAAAVRSQA
jgi:predicted metalloprotease